MTETGFLENCCWDWIRDQCRDAERCACACHVVYPKPAPVCGHEAEMERYRQRSRDEDTVRIRLNHERIRLREALDLIATGVWTAPNSVETIVYTAQRALKGRD